MLEDRLGRSLQAVLRVNTTRDYEKTTIVEHYTQPQNWDSPKQFGNFAESTSKATIPKLRKKREGYILPANLNIKTPLNKDEHAG